MAVSASLHHRIVMHGRGGSVELLNGQGVERSVRFKVSIDHGGVRGLEPEEVMRGKGTSVPAVFGVSHDRFDCGLKLRIHGDHGGGKWRRSVGLVGGEFRCCARRFRLAAKKD